MAGERNKSNLALSLSLNLFGAAREREGMSQIPENEAKALEMPISVS